MAIERMPITPEVVTWARERLGYEIDQLATKRNEFKRVADWESGDSQPTYRQLEQLAKDLWVPVAVFFFPEPPQVPEIEETFRTLGTAQFEEVPPGIRRLLLKARAFQSGLAELNSGRNPANKLIVRHLPLDLSEPIASSAGRIREFLGLSLEEQFGWQGNYDAALKAWRSAFYLAGVTVFKDAFKEEDYCGFSLYDDEFPIIYVNNTNTRTRQIFTLFHELAHLLFHTSGIDLNHGFRNPFPADKQQLETTCNRLAATILVPDDALDLEIRDSDMNRPLTERVARKFCVSREVIYRRFRDRGLVADAEYESAKQLWDSQVASAKGGGGGNYYRTKIAYLGEEYVSLVFRRFYQERIDEEELADYLAIKPKNIDQLEDALLEVSR